MKIVVTGRTRQRNPQLDRFRDALRTYRDWDVDALQVKLGTLVGRVLALNTVLADRGELPPLSPGTRDALLALYTALLPANTRGVKGEGSAEDQGPAAAPGTARVRRPDKDQRAIRVDLRPGRDGDRHAAHPQAGGEGVRAGGGEADGGASGGAEEA